MSLWGVDSKKDWESRQAIFGSPVVFISDDCAKWRWVCPHFIAKTATDFKADFFNGRICRVIYGFRFFSGGRVCL